MEGALRFKAMNKISERQLEDWVCKHPEKFGPDMVIIGRQIRVPHGIIDVLAYDGRILVMELKARRLEEKDLGQVMRYVYDVGQIMLEAGMRLKPSPQDDIRTLRYSFFEDLWYTHHGNMLDLCDPAHAVLIGPSIDKKALAAANGAGIDVHLYGDDFSLRLSQVDGENYDQYPMQGWVAELSNLILGDCVTKANQLFERQVEKLFGMR